MADDTNDQKTPTGQRAAGGNTEGSATDADWGLSGDLGTVDKVAPEDAVNHNKKPDDDGDLSDWAAALAEQEETDAEKKEVKPALSSFEDFSEPTEKKPTHTDIEMILDIPVQITAELGRTKMEIRNLLRLAHGSVIELDGLAGEPMDVLVNGCLIARGEVVVVNDRFGIRLTDIITPSERIRKLNQ